MHPASSILVFTTASGAGYGLLCLLGLAGALQHPVHRHAVCLQQLRLEQDGLVAQQVVADGGVPGEEAAGQALQPVALRVEVMCLMVLELPVRAARRTRPWGRRGAGS